MIHVGSKGSDLKEQEVNRYNLLLNEYLRMIDSGDPWWDGRREALVERMNKVWNSMKEKERQEAMRYVHLLYQKRIS